MSKAIQKVLKDQDWYKALIEELDAVISETISFSREIVLQGKWLVGQYIEKAVKDFKRAEIYGSKINSLLAKDLNWSEREIARCRQFYNKYPEPTWKEAFMKLPGGNNISWHKMTLYLSDGSSSEKDDKHYMSVLVNETEKAIYIKDKYKQYKIKYF